MVFPSLLSADCSWYIRHRKAIHEMVAEMSVYKHIYVCAHNIYIHGHTYFFLQRPHISAAFPSTPEWFLPAAVSICRQALLNG